MNILTFPQREKIFIRVGYTYSQQPASGIGQGEEDVYISDHNVWTEVAKGVFI
jgi:hypothetical protein